MAYVVKQDITPRAVYIGGSWKTLGEIPIIREASPPIKGEETLPLLTQSELKTLYLDGYSHLIDFTEKISKKEKTDGNNGELAKL